jgi:hypothetical protein
MLSHSIEIPCRNPHTHDTMVARKTPAATAMAGAQTTIINQLQVAAATATETAMMTVMTTTMKTKAKAKAKAGAAWQLCGGQRGGSAAVALAVVALWRQWQRGGRGGSSMWGSAAAVWGWQWQQWQLGSGSGNSLAAA